MKVLACGGAGYIGAHVASLLLQQGHDVVVYDNLTQGSEAMVRNASDIAGKPLPLVVGDVRDAARLGEVLQAGGFDCAILDVNLRGGEKSWPIAAARNVSPAASITP